MPLCSKTSNSELLRLSEASKLIPTRPNISTMWRWVMKGIVQPNGERVRLRHLRVGRSIFVREEYLTEFFEKLAEAKVRAFDEELEETSV